ncbi:hypothetical protein [Sphingomonas sp.]|uniref:hypothetical protein n=1 Tax=Sphingomonas sp. TaxID=28214 RepID=UPI0025D8E53D|nr:hypothetical protein [Sphingomonas sp.]
MQNTRKIALIAIIFALFPPFFSPAAAQRAAPPPPPVPSYARVAELVLGAPVIIDSVVRSAQKLKPAESPGLPPNHVRFDITADVRALIRGSDSAPARISYLADVPLDARGRPPKLAKQRVLLFGRAVPGRADQIQLTALAAQQPWSAPLDALTRRIAAEVVDPAAPPAISGIGNAFHVPGTLPGEGETQIFLNTPDGRPVSINIIRRPGEAVRWGVALSEIVDEAAAPPARDTLLWYRLACHLPRALPAGATATMEADDARAARADYAFVLDALGPCS